MYRSHKRPTAEAVWKDCVFLKEQKLPNFFNKVKKRLFDTSDDTLESRDSLKKKLQSHSGDIFGDSWKNRMPIETFKANGMSGNIRDTSIAARTFFLLPQKILQAKV